MTDIPRGYKQTEVGVIPTGWQVSELDSVAHILDPQPDHRTPPAATTGEPYIGISDFVDDHTVNWEGCRKVISRAVDKQEASFQLKPGNIIFGKIGTIGEPKFVPIVPFRYALSANVLLVQPTIDSTFVMSWLRSKTCQKAVNGELHSTSQAAFGINKMRRLMIPIPSDPEQRAIATALSDVDALLGSLDRLIAKKRDLKQAAMQQLLTGQTRLTGFHGEWKNTTLGQIISRFSTGLNPRQNFRLNSGGNFFYVTIKNFAVGHLFLDENCDLIDKAAFWRINERSDLQKDDVLFSSIGRVGDAYLITETPRNWNINESVFTLRPDKSHVVPLMLFYLLTDKTVTDALSQGVTGSTFKSIKQAQLKAIPCHLPASLEEQTAIAAVLSDMDAELATLEQRRDKTRALKQAMMQELLTGRIRLV